MGDRKKSVLFFMDTLERTELPEKLKERGVDVHLSYMLKSRYPVDTTGYDTVQFVESPSARNRMYRHIDMIICADGVYHQMYHMYRDVILSDSILLIMYTTSSSLDNNVRDCKQLRSQFPGDVLVPHVMRMGEITHKVIVTALGSDRTFLLARNMYADDIVGWINNNRSMGGRIREFGLEIPWAHREVYTRVEKSTAVVGSSPSIPSPNDPVRVTYIVDWIDSERINSIKRQCANGTTIYCIYRTYPLQRHGVVPRDDRIHFIHVDHANTAQYPWTNADVIVCDYGMYNVLMDRCATLGRFRPFIVMHNPGECSDVTHAGIATLVGNLLSTSAVEAMPHAIIGFCSGTDGKIQRALNDHRRIEHYPRELTIERVSSYARVRRAWTSPNASASSSSSSSATDPDAPSSSSSSSSSSEPPVVRPVISDEDPNYQQFFDDAWTEWSEMANQYRQLHEKMVIGLPKFRATIMGAYDASRISWPLYEVQDRPIDPEQINADRVTEAKNRLNGAVKEHSDARLVYIKRMDVMARHLDIINDRIGVVMTSIDAIDQRWAEYGKTCAALANIMHTEDVLQWEYDRHKTILENKERQSAEDKWNRDVERSTAYIKGMMAIDGMGATEIWLSRAALTAHKIADDAFQAAMIKCELTVPEDQVNAKQTGSASASESECVVCMDGPKNQVLTPCGHICVCVDCARMLLEKPCPICKSHVAGYNKVFHS